MRVNVAEPTTSNAPTAWRTARWKLRSCGNTGRQSERRARKRTSNTVRGSGSTCTKALPRLIRYQIKMSKLQRTDVSVQGRRGVSFRADRPNRFREMGSEV